LTLRVVRKMRLRKQPHVLPCLCLFY